MTEPEPKPCTCLFPHSDFGHDNHCVSAKDLPKRAIHPEQKRALLARLFDLWNRHYPDLRFGQFIAVVHRSASAPGPDLFLIEDETLVEAAERFVRDHP